MKRRLALFAFLLLTAATSAMAQSPGVNLAWDDCIASTAGGLNKTSTCSSNTEASKSLFGSYVLPQDATALVGNDILIDILTNTVTLPCWWNFTVGPRTAGYAVDFNVPCANNAFDYWGTIPSGQTGNAVAESAPFGNALPRLRIHAVVGVRSDEAQPVPQSTGEIFSFRLQLKFDATVGSCTGCSTAACFWLRRIIVGQVGAPDFVLTQPSARNWVLWQGGVVAPPVCPDSHLPVPTLNNTWGAVKALYR